MDQLKKLLARFGGPLIGLGFAVLLIAIHLFGGNTGLLYQLELKAVDSRLRLRGPQEADPRVVIIAIDRDSIDAYGQWPWDRALVGELIEKASDMGAVTIALDIIFSEPARSGPEEDAALATHLRNSRNVVLGYFFVLEAEAAETREITESSADSIQRAQINVAQGPRGGFQIAEAARVETNIDIIADTSPHFGFFNITPDADGVVRFYYSLLKYENYYYPSLAVKAVQRFYGGDYIELSPYQGVLPRISIGDNTIFNDEEGRILLNYRGAGRETFQTISAVDLLRGDVDPAALEGRLVFVGITETGVGDFRPTPMDAATPGVEVHATAADNMLTGRYLYRTFASLAVDYLILLVLCTGMGWVGRFFHNAVKWALVGVSLIIGFAVVAYYLFVLQSVWIFVVTPVIGLSLSMSSSFVYQNFFAEQQARLIRQTFKQVVSPVVVEEMLKDPDKVRLGGERRDLSVLFSDIRGFTSISEKLPPEVVLEILNEYLTPMTDIVFEQKGTFDKYMGDAIMAIWNAPSDQPDHAAMACRAALGMKSALVTLNQDWQKTRRLEAIKIGIGINSGPMSVGYMGSEMIKSYTVLGDNVNLGSRLEGLTKYYHTDIAVSGETTRRAGDGFCFRELDKVRVKGKKEAVTVYQLVDLQENLGNRKLFFDAYRQALERYKARDFRGAVEEFKKALALNPQDFTTQMYINRATVYAVKPPDIDWDGVTTMDSK